MKRSPNNLLNYRKNFIEQIKPNVNVFKKFLCTHIVTLSIYYIKE